MYMYAYTFTQTMATLTRTLISLLAMTALYSLGNGLRDCPCEDSNLCLPVQRHTDKEVLGFMTSADNWPKYNWSELTTLALFAQLNDSNLNQLLCHAHANNVRLVTSINSDILKLENETSRRQYMLDHLKYVEVKKLHYMYEWFSHTKSQSLFHLY